MNKISNYELFCLTVLNCCSIFPGIGASFSIKDGRTTSLISASIGLLLGIITIILITNIKKHIKGNSIFDFKENKNILIRITAIIIIIISLIIFFINSWTIINFFISQLLTRNSYYILAIVFFLSVFFLANKKTTTITRVSIILFIFYLFFSITTFICLADQINVENILPIFTTNKINFIKVIIYAYSFVTSPVILLLSIPKKELKEEKKYTKTILIGYITSITIMILYLFYIISIYGVDLAEIAIYPGYYLYKNIKIFNFIERIENILIGGYINCNFINFVLISHIIKNITKEITKKHNSIITLIITITIPIISIYTFKKDYIYTIYKYYPYMLFIALILTSLISIILILKKTKQKKH